MKRILNGTYIDIGTYERKCLELEEVKEYCDEVIIQQNKRLDDFIEAFQCHSDCRWFGKRHQKCSCCKRNLSIKDNYEPEDQEQ